MTRIDELQLKHDLSKMGFIDPLTKEEIDEFIELTKDENFTKSLE